MTQVSINVGSAPGRMSGPLRRVVAAGTVSSTGDGLTTLALGLLALDATSDARLIALVFVAGRLPWLAGIPLARMVDATSHPGRVMLAADAVRGVALAGAALSLLVAAPSIALLAALAFVLGTATMAHTAARNALLPVVGHGAALAKANGYLGAGEGLGYAAIGPAIGGAVYEAGRAVPFAIDAASFASSFALSRPLARVQVETRGREAADRSVARAVTAHPLLRMLLVQMTVLGTAQAMVLAVTPLYLRDRLGLSDRWFGVFLGLAALGGIATSVITPHLWARRRHTAGLVLGAGVAAGAAYVGMSFETGVMAAFALLLAFDSTVGVMNTVSPTLRMEHAPDGARAQTATLFSQAIVVGQPLGALASGLIARRYGVERSYLVAGALAFCTFLLTAVPLARALARYED